MPHQFALSIGESFAELLGFSANPREPGSIFFHTRWFLPKRSLSDGLLDALKESGLKPENGEWRLIVATDAVERILMSNQGRSPAILMSAGFETLPSVFDEPRLPRFSRYATLAKNLLINHDSVFSVGGRIGTDGLERAPLSRVDLEAIAAKLTLMKVTEVALAFLNAKNNPEHEKEAARFFSQKGFRVFSSHLMPGHDEFSNWRLAIENAFAESAVLEEKQQIENALAQFGGNWRMAVWTNQGPRSWDSYHSSFVRAGIKQALGEAAQKTLSQGPSLHQLHCGLDGFRYLGEALAQLPLGSFDRARPTQRIVHSDWPFPHYSDEAVSFAPGPMLFGKSQQLAALDVLYVSGGLANVPGLSPLISEKSRQRILESLFTLAKISTGAKQSPDPIVIAETMQKLFVEIVVLPFAAAEVKGRVRLTGPLGESFKPLLISRRPDLTFFCDEMSAWEESVAVASGLKEVAL